MPAEPVILYKYLPAWGIPDISPFCVKVEAFLRIAQIPFSTAVGDPRKAPKGKLPVLRDGTQLVADSTRIIQHLEATRKVGLDLALTQQQIAIATAITGMLEEQLYFVIVYQRWKDDEAWARYRPLFVELGSHLGVPRPLRGFISDRIRKQFLATLYGQGMGRHTPDEVVTIGKRIIDSVATLLVGPYYFGDHPSSLDATVYAFIGGILDVPFDGPLKDHLASKGQLVAHCRHIAARHFPIRGEQADASTRTAPAMAPHAAAK